MQGIYDTTPAERFAILSELGFPLADICAHMRVDAAALDVIARENFDEGATEANARLRAAGPMHLLVAASKRAVDGNERILVYLLDKLWRPQAPTERKDETLAKVPVAVMEKIHKLLNESGVL